MISFTVRGSTKKTEDWLKKMQKAAFFSRLNSYGQEGVTALAAATPVESGLTAQSWTYRVSKRKGRYTITWNNTHVVDNVQIAVIIQYGHMTRNGGWVEGIDYINPVIRPLFKKIADEIWNEVKKDG